MSDIWQAASFLDAIEQNCKEAIEDDEVGTVPTTFFFPLDEEDEDVQRHVTLVDGEWQKKFGVKNPMPAVKRIVEKEGIDHYFVVATGTYESSEKDEAGTMEEKYVVSEGVDSPKKVIVMTHFTKTRGTTVRILFYEERTNWLTKKLFGRVKWIDRLDTETKDFDEAVISTGLNIWHEETRIYNDREQK